MKNEEFYLNRKNRTEEVISTKKERTKIEVFFSKKSNEFRAVIKEPNAPKYEVNVGGQEWNKGKGLKHKEVILKKIKSKIDNLVEKFNILENG